MKNEYWKFDLAFIEMMTAAARYAGFKGKLEITMLRPKAHEEISENRRDRNARRYRRKSASIV